ncbi:hypothetical protein POM88_049232 [Heracleum sosnowskyi]|uniref:Uncharacterized protein n=1 Tax=Heracleum sosnowskyi TaxID=360622 RepID=A0AAD8GXT5_9APIA|nr:hypothetical protein POM88_049232 [Heracleum sosnowskyi]
MVLEIAQKQLKIQNQAKLKSGGYVGDESSFYKSDKEYAVENLSNPKIMSKTSRHSWVYRNWSESPYSVLQPCIFYSPESAEKPKSDCEMWAMMAFSTWKLSREETHVETHHG